MSFHSHFFIRRLIGLGETDIETIWRRIPQESVAFKQIFFVKEKRVKEDLLIRKIFLFLSTISAALVLLIITFVFLESIPVFTSNLIVNIFQETTWRPAYNSFGILPLIVGSFVVVFIAILIALPIGVGASIYISEFAPKKLRDPLLSVIELLASIPSVIYGFIGLVFLVPFISQLLKLNSGATALTASLILIPMIVPIIISISSEILSSVPKEYREISAALGASKFQTTLKVILPASKSGIFASVILAFGRAIGETIAVLFVCGATGKFPSFPFITESVLTMTSAIAMYMGEAAIGENLYYVLFFIGFSLMLISFIVNNIAERIVEKQREKVGGIRIW
ncbi:MAG: phosphate ABC transporter permease subunit PstC [Candidatus Latescibacterota bacterium]|nr:MAG: phosphate ABC transporter permease subunit PstC [Candidatus Latescibacterota bacterium]